MRLRHSACVSFGACPKSKTLSWGRRLTSESLTHVGALAGTCNNKHLETDHALRNNVFPDEISTAFELHWR